MKKYTKNACLHYKNLNHTHPVFNSGKRPGFPDIKNNSKLLEIPVVITKYGSEYDDEENLKKYQFPNKTYYNGELYKNAINWYNYHYENNNTIYWFILDIKKVYIGKLIKKNDEDMYLEVNNELLLNNFI